MKVIEYKKNYKKLLLLRYTSIYRKIVYENKYILLRKFIAFKKILKSFIFINSIGIKMDQEPYGESINWISLTPTRSFDVIHIDYGTDVTRSVNGYRSYLIAVDIFTKNPIVYPVRRSDSSVMVEFLEEIFAMFQVPRVIISDSNIRFRSQAYVDMVERHNILAVRKNCNFHVPNMAEGIIGQVRRTIVALARSNITWDENLQNIVNSALSNR